MAVHERRQVLLKHMAIKIHITTASLGMNILLREINKNLFLNFKKNLLKHQIFSQKTTPAFLLSNRSKQKDLNPPNP